MLLKLMLDPIEYTKKPDDPHIITNRIVNYPKNVDVITLSREVEKGKSFICGYIPKGKSRKEDNWESQQLIALDFDNEELLRDEAGKPIKDSNNKLIKVKHVTVTLNSLLKDNFIKKYASFIYETFSHTEDHPKLRVVFVLDKPIYQLHKVKNIIHNLIKYKFPTADKQCVDGTRLFYGGKKIHVINYSNTLPTDLTLWEDIKSFLSIYPAKGCKSKSLNINSELVKNKDSPNNTRQNIYINNTNIARNIEYIKSRDVKSLHNIINPKPIELNNIFQINDYLKSQDLKIYLGASKSLYDIFHDESKPSASIYQSNSKSKHWLYKCHSYSSSFTGTILQITEKLLKCSAVEARKFLMEVYKIKLVENDVQKRLREEIDQYKYILQSEELEELYPNFYKLFNRYGYLDNLYVLLDLIKENLPANCDDPQLLFFHSINTLAEKFRKSPTVTGIRMNFFAFFKLICKLSESEIPKEILQIHNRNKANNKYRYRSNVYKMEIYSYDFFAELDRKCEEWTKKGLTTKSMNYEGILRNFGREEADRVFPQDTGKEIPQLNEDVVSVIEKTTLEIISQKGWTFEKEVLENVLLYFKGQKKFKEKQFKRCIGDMFDKYDLKIINTNKKVKEAMKITEEQLPKQSFPKLIVKSGTKTS